MSAHVARWISSSATSSPGSCIPSVAALSTSIARASDLRLFHLDDIGPHYATTLAHWRDATCATTSRRFADLGYGEEFIRMWEYYTSATAKAASWSA